LLLGLADVGFWVLVYGGDAGEVPRLEGGERELRDETRTSSMRRRFRKRL
jgi:hypothetical protein